MAVFPNVRTYGNPSESPGQRAKPQEPGRFPDDPDLQQPGHSWKTQFMGYEPSAATTVRDRHAVMNRGTERSGRATSNGGGGYGPDPLKDGPAHPSLRLINRSFHPQAGTDSTRNQDDLTRGYRTEPTGQWAGTQDGSSQQIFGGTPGLWIPYGSYGGYIAGDVQGIQGPAVGEPGDGNQFIPNSPPHGLHSRTLPGTIQSLSRTAATRQQTGPRVDRPSNSKIAGQSYSQTVVFQGQVPFRPGSFREGMPRKMNELGGDGWRGN